MSQDVGAHAPFDSTQPPENVLAAQVVPSIAHLAQLSLHVYSTQVLVSHLQPKLLTIQVELSAQEPQVLSQVLAMHDPLDSKQPPESVLAAHVLPSIAHFAQFSLQV